MAIYFGNSLVVVISTTEGKRCFLAKKLEVCGILHALKIAKELGYKKISLLSNA